jgi:hypothetical protein
MSQQLQQELDRAIGDGPAHRPVEETLQAGRAALRRRRVGAVAAAAVLALVGTTYAVVSPGADRHATGEVAVDPTPSPTEEPVPVSRPWGKGETVRYADDGALEIRSGVEVHEHIENPYGYAPPATSDALDLTFRGSRTWAILERHADGESASFAQPSNGWASFADYVADQVDGVTGGDDGWPETMRLSGDAVVPTAGTTVHNRTDDPRLGDSFAPPGATTGAAVVTVAGDDKSYFVVWRVVDGTLDVITTPPNQVTGATFEELLSYARAQYASGEGMR